MNLQHPAARRGTVTARLTCLHLFLPRPLPLSLPSQTLRRTPPSADPSLARSLMSTELTQGSVELLSHPIFADRHSNSLPVLSPPPLAPSFLPSFLRGNCLLSPFANNFPRAVPIGCRDSAPGLRQNNLSLETWRTRRRRRLLGTNSPKYLVSTSCSAKGGREGGRERAESLSLRRPNNPLDMLIMQISPGLDEWWGGREGRVETFEVSIWPSVRTSSHSYLS